jgi:hypothetical protein
VSLSEPELCAVATLVFGLGTAMARLAHLVRDQSERWPIEMRFEERQPRPEPPALPEHVGGYRTSARR